MADILAFGAHPDDIEFGCGGIIARQAALGHTIVMVDLTLGQKGTNGTPAQRRQEGLNAAKVVGAERLFLDFEDCQVYDTYDARLKIVEMIRTHTPRLVLAPYWKGECSHPDHLACGTMVRYACRYARFRKILPDLPVHRIDGVLHYLPPGVEACDFLIDVSDHLETWKRMMACHRSQLDTMPYPDWVLRHASKLGVLTETDYAQGLASGNPVVIDDVLTVGKGTREF